MKTLITLALLTLSAFSVNAQSKSYLISKTAPPVGYTYEAQFIRVLDGDTIKVNISLGFNMWVHDKSIRLLEVYAPETHTKDAVEKENGEKVKAFVESKLNADAHIIVQTFKPDSQDLYGRYLAVIWVNGSNLNMDINEFMQKSGIVPAGKGLKK